MTATLPFRRYRFRLRLLHSARLHFRHEVMLHSLLSETLGKGELPEMAIPFASESGRIDFAKDDDYRIGLTVTGEEPDRFADHLARALGVYGSRGFQGDGIPMLRWFGVEPPEALRAPDLDGECHALAGRPELVLQFVSPLRLEVPKGSERRPAEFFSAAGFPADAFFRLLWNRLFFLRQGRFPHRDEIASGLPPLPPLACDPRHLLWIDLPRVHKPLLGGVMGRLVLQNPGEEWLPLLVAGGYLHIGKSTGFGFGAYRIVEDAAALWNDPFGPSQTSLERVAQRERLTAAARHVVASTSAGGVDGIGPEQFTRDEEAILGGLSSALAQGTYAPAPLLGILLPKGHSKVRALAVPTLSDRSVQRAAYGILGPAIETLLEDCSYAYRKGFSRAGAAQAIQKAYADGYRWVLDADIDSFFDAVDWERLFGKIDALYPFEPLTAILRGWVTAPVVYQGALIPRHQGLPQGAVISPLLANLFLDEVDEELLGDDFRLVRYADDFVVLCKDVASAERAREAAAQALARLGLTLHEEKTAIRDLDHGFSYLGYLFCRSTVIEQQPGTELPADSSRPPVVSPASWLARVDLSRVRELPGAPDRASGPRVVPLVPASPAGRDPRRPLYVSDPSLRLHLDHETVVVEKEGDAPRRYPLRSLSLVVFLGRPRATLPLVLDLGLAGVPVFFCRRNGELEAVHGPFHPEPEIWVAQGKAALDEPMRLAFAQEIVAAKLHNFATMAVRHQLRGAERVAGTIRDLERSVWNKTELDSVRGLEGAAAAAYFGSVADTLDAEWRFEGRVRHPPRDPFNAMLSYGYTLLYHHCVAALYAAGLLPRIGLFHAGHGTWDALGSDLQEEFRHLVDGLVWSLVRRHEVQPSDFERSEEGCWFIPDARRKFIAALEERMETIFTPDGALQAIAYREAIVVQAGRIRDYVLGRGRYAALRAHS
jgi:group II intron reverse transcriptase/maturase/CRISPR-associated endonuclease Cas1